MVPECYIKVVEVPTFIFLFSLPALHPHPPDPSPLFHRVTSFLSLILTRSLLLPSPNRIPPRYPHPSLSPKPPKMKSTTFLAYFLALFAMFFGLSSTTSAETITDLEPRAAAPTKPVGAAFDATIDLLVKEHSDIVVKAFADVCTDANLSTDITTDIRVQIRYGDIAFL